MIIVTGGAGFIGSNIINALNMRGINQIILVDNLKKSSKHLNLNKLQVMDYIDKEDFLKHLSSFKNIQTVFHEGACSDTMETDGKYMMQNNYEYSKELLNYCLINKTDFIYASSASVYGYGKNGFREEFACEYPLNIYAFSKLFFDNFVRRILANKKIESQILGLRYFNVFGYNENHKGSMASVPFHLFNQLKQNQNLKLFEGSKNFLRDFIFVDDVVKVNLFFYDNRQNGIYNCGTGNAQSFDIIGKTIEQLDAKAKIEYIPFPEKLIGKYQDFTKADLTNLQKAGYKEKFTSLEEGIASYYKKFQTTGGFLY